MTTERYWAVRLGKWPHAFFLADDGYNARLFRTESEANAIMLKMMPTYYVRVVRVELREVKRRGKK